MPPFSSISWTVRGLLFELVAGRRDAPSLFLREATGGVAHLREALADRDPAAAEARRWPPRPARAPSKPSPRRWSGAARGRCPSRWSSASTAAAKVAHSSEASALQRMLGDVEPRHQLAELLLDLVGSLAHRGADGCLPLVQCVEAAPDPRSCGRGRARAPAAGRFGGGSRQAARRSWLCSCRASGSSVFRQREGVMGADANALPGGRAPGGYCRVILRWVRGRRDARNSPAAAASPRASASFASPSSAAVAGLPASARKRLSRA